MRLGGRAFSAPLLEREQLRDFGINLAESSKLVHYGEPAQFPSALSPRLYYTQFPEG